MTAWFIWVGLGILFLFIEILTVSFYISIIGIGFIIAGICATFIHNFPIQLLIAITSSVLGLIFLRPFLLHTLLKNSTASNIEAIIGKQTIVTEMIDNAKETGSIKIAGDYWRARSTDSQIITEGSTVTITKIEGVTAYVTIAKD